MSTEAATAALSDSLSGRMGRMIFFSHSESSSPLRPFPSLPTATAACASESARTSSASAAK